LKPKDFEEAKGVPESQRAQWLAEHREQRQLEWIVAHLQHDSGFEPVPMGTPGKRDPHGQEMVAGVGICVRETFTVRAFKGHKSDDRPPEHKKPIELHAVIFEGVLRVTNPARALKTIQHGIGPAKGLGFGLLLLGRRLAIREGESANR
jgi:CRISPR-associated protein Cas6/Cse3/CasE subtype I-E